MLEMVSLCNENEWINDGIHNAELSPNYRPRASSTFPLMCPPQSTIAGSSTPQYQHWYTLEHKEVVKKVEIQNSSLLLYRPPEDNPFQFPVGFVLGGQLRQILILFLSLTFCEPEYMPFSLELLLFPILSKHAFPLWGLQSL